LTTKWCRPTFLATAVIFPVLKGVKEIKLDDIPFARGMFSH
jgi:hypothetical protein